MKVYPITAPAKAWLTDSICRNNRHEFNKSIRTRLVLDTNVVLSLLYWQDQHRNWLKNAWFNDGLEAVRDDKTLAELQLVLSNEKLNTTSRSIAEILQLFVKLTVNIPQGDTSLKLPQCRDHDDQKFLELAERSNAHALVTLDKVVLKLNKRVNFLIATPEALLGRPEFHFLRYSAAGYLPSGEVVGS